jgi:hypothetical protein
MCCSNIIKSLKILYKAQIYVMTCRQFVYAVTYYSIGDLYTIKLYLFYIWRLYHQIWTSGTNKDMNMTQFFISCSGWLVKNLRYVPDFIFKYILYSCNKTWTLRETFVLKQPVTDSVQLYIVVGKIRSKQNTYGEFISGLWNRVVGWIVGWLMNNEFGRK